MNEPIMKVHCGNSSERDFSTQCEAIARKTNGRCPHRCRWILKPVLAGHFALDGRQFAVYGRRVHLCAGHHNSFLARQKRLLSVRLIDGGYLSAYNRHGYGQLVTATERINWDRPGTLRVPEAWGPREWGGNVPETVARRLGLNHEAHEAHGGTP